MSELYEKILEYNRQNSRYLLSEFKWLKNYINDKPPIYWSKLKEYLEKLPRDLYCFEAGSGSGDILSLLLGLGFNDCNGIEREEKLADFTIKKLYKLYGRKDILIRGNYPYKLERKPDVLLQINCVYGENTIKKEDFLSELKKWHIYNGTPKYYILEVIDSVFTEFHPAYPEHVRLSKDDVFEAFQDYDIEFFETYRYPKDSSSKVIYIIKSRE